MNKQIDTTELVPAMRFLMESRPNLYPDKMRARWALNSRKETGLDTAIVRVGRLLFISPSRFDKWMSGRLESNAA